MMLNMKTTSNATIHMKDTTKVIKYATKISNMKPERGENILGYLK